MPGLALLSPSNVPKRADRFFFLEEKKEEKLENIWPSGGDERKVGEGVSEIIKVKNVGQDLLRNTILFPIIIISIIVYMYRLHGLLGANLLLGIETCFQL